MNTSNNYSDMSLPIPNQYEENLINAFRKLSQYLLCLPGIRFTMRDTYLHER